MWRNILDTSCGGVYKDGSGTISSPGFPNGYENNLDCVWLVYRTVDIPDFIFTDFETESNYDLVKISAGRLALLNVLWSCMLLASDCYALLTLASKSQISRYGNKKWT